jgi:type VI secretion system effector, hcp1 family
MASDFFLKLDGIDGQSNDKAHGKWIEVMEFSHGGAQNVSLARGADVAGRGQFLPFSFTHLVDKATPKLQQFCMNGQKIAKAEFHVCRAIAGVSTSVYEVKLENVKVARAEVKVADVRDGSGAVEPVETVELIAGKITWKVTPIKPDNTKDGAIEAAFDQISNS